MLETQFGPIAKDGDYVVVVDVNWLKGKCGVYLAKVYNGKAYTGKKKTPYDGKYIHKKKAICVVPAKYVDEEEKCAIMRDIAENNPDIDKFC